MFISNMVPEIKKKKTQQIQGSLSTLQAWFQKLSWMLWFIVWQHSNHPSVSLFNIIIIRSYKSFRLLHVHCLTGCVGLLQDQNVAIPWSDSFVVAEANRYYCEFPYSLEVNANAATWNKCLFPNPYLMAIKGHLSISFESIKSLQFKPR